MSFFPGSRHPEVRALKIGIGVGLVQGLGCHILYFRQPTTTKEPEFGALVAQRQLCALGQYRLGSNGPAIDGNQVSSRQIFCIVIIIAEEYLDVVVGNGVVGDHEIAARWISTDRYGQ